MELFRVLSNTPHFMILTCSILTGFNPGPAGPVAQGGDVTTQDQEKVTNEISQFCFEPIDLQFYIRGLNFIVRSLCRRLLSCKC